MLNFMSYYYCYYYVDTKIWNKFLKLLSWNNYRFSRKLKKIVQRGPTSSSPSFHQGLHLHSSHVRIRQLTLILCMCVVLSYFIPCVDWCRHHHSQGTELPRQLKASSVPPLHCHTLFPPTISCAVEFSHSVTTLCNPMDCSPPGSSVHGDSPGQ